MEYVVMDVLSTGHKDIVKDELVHLPNAKKTDMTVRRIEAYVEVNGERRLMVFITNNEQWSPGQCETYTNGVGTSTTNSLSSWIRGMPHYTCLLRDASGFRLIRNPLIPPYLTQISGTTSTRYHLKLPTTHETDPPPYVLSVPHPCWLSARQ